MSIEERLTRSLEEEADQIDVDVVRLLGVTRGRLTAKRAVRRRGGGRTLLAAAAAVAVIAAGAAGGAWLIGDDDPTPIVPPKTDGVSNVFACPAQHSIDFATDNQDEFMAWDLDELGGPRGLAREYGAPRYEFVEAGDRATLRLGNADGSLGSSTTYRKAGNGWEPVTAQVCTGAGGSPGGPTAEELRLGRHGTEPWPRAEMLYGVEIPTGVFIDDRPTYNYAGIIDTHRSIWVTPCGNRMCWYSGRPDSYVLAHWPPDDGPVVRDMSGVFFLPDDMVGRVNPYGMWSVYDRNGAVESLAVTLRDGTQLTGQRFTSPAWDEAALYVVVAPWSDVRSVDLVEADGDITHQAPEEVRGYEPH